jgi:ribosome recycling factor
MAYDFSLFQKRAKDIEEWLKKEFSLLRTGRASQAILDAITVNAYGSPMPVSHVANIAIEDPKTLRIVPFDKTQMKAIEEAIRLANTGLSVTADDAGVRLISPELTSERRAQVVKLLKEKLEEARITLRKEREAVLDILKKEKQEGTLSEDGFFKGRDALQKYVDDTNVNLESLASKKQKDIEG